MIDCSKGYDDDLYWAVSARPCVDTPIQAMIGDPVWDAVNEAVAEPIYNAVSGVVLPPPTWRAGAY